MAVVTAMTQPAKPVFSAASFRFGSAPVPTLATPVPTALLPTGFDILLALHLPGDEVAFTITHFILNSFTLPQEKLNLNPREVAAYEEVSNYLADPATHENRPFSWISGAPTLSPETQTAFTITLQRLTFELTGEKMGKLKLPGGKVRTEVVAYLTLVQVRTYAGRLPKDVFPHSEHCGGDVWQP